MSGFTVTTNYHLRSLYSKDRTFAAKKTRAEQESQTLQKADQDALRKGIRALEDWDFDNDEENSKKKVKADFYNQLKAFVDSYNYTLESGDASSEDDRTIKNTTKNIRTLTSKYKEQLSDLGIKTDKKGYMSVSKSALDNIAIENYKDVLGSKSKYMKSLTEYSKHVSRHINQTA